MAQIPRRVLGRTGLEVTTLSYGTNELRGEPRGRALAEDDVARILNAVLDAGINLLDTSIDYGLSEERIGRHLSHRRDEYVLAGKCGCLVGWSVPAGEPPGQVGRQPHDFSRRNIVSGVEQSLRLLRTDRLDILQVHDSPGRELLERHDVVATLQGLQEQGKVRYIGMSGTLPDLLDHIDMGVFDTFQVPYSALDLEHAEAITQAAGAGAGVIVRGGAGRGAPSRERRAVERNPRLTGTWEASGIEELLDGMSPMEFTLRFTVSHPGMTTTIVGTVNPAHLGDNIAAVAKGPLPDDLYAEARRRLLETQRA